MIENKNSYHDKEIDFSDLISELWKKRYLVSVICFLFGLLGYFYESQKPKTYVTKIIVRDAPTYLFDEYRKFFEVDFKPNLNTSKEQSLTAYTTKASQVYLEEFRLQLNSVDTLSNFYSQNKKLNNFREKLDKKNIEYEDHLREKFFQSLDDKKTIIPNNFSFIFEKPFPGPLFLNEYVLFVKKKVDEEYKNNLVNLILNRIKLYEKNLIIAKKINLENPILRSTNQGNSVTIEPDPLYYKGSIVLKEEISDMKKIIEKVKAFEFNYSPILDKASKPINITRSPFVTAIILVITSFILISFILSINFLLKK